ncbi:MAG: aspartate-semialdehyde dehydrogenase [Oligoflexales bacterium]|nr:aspartate-semialdehyde dehydrogenase [Oligoflexales bacterium]
MKIKVAVLGASGAVGREMLADLENSPICQKLDVHLFASPRSAGEVISFNKQNLKIKAFELNALEGFSYALASAGSAFTKQYGRDLAKMGLVLIDNSSAFRMQTDVPLVVPEVNFHAIDREKIKKGGIIANPNCSTIPLVMALRPLQDKFGIDFVSVATYQSVSGAGQKGIKELADQVHAHFRFAEVPSQVFAQPIAFNVLPTIDVIDQDGHCYEEEKVIRESRKILDLDALQVFATTARVPTFNCHCEAVTVQLRKEVDLVELQEALGSQAGLQLSLTLDPKQMPSPNNFKGQTNAIVSRARLPLGQKKSKIVQFWLVVDNLKKGASSNAVQILERLVQA